MTVNRVILVGKLGQDPETKCMANGDCICSFSLATSETWKDKQTGEKKERTEWHRISAWRQLGEFCGKYLTKGKQVYLEGKLQTRSWDKDGQKHYTTEILASEVKFVGGATQQERQEPKQQYSEPPAAPDDPNSDLPF